MKGPAQFQNRLRFLQKKRLILQLKGNFLKAAVLQAGNILRYETISLKEMETRQISETLRGMSGPRRLIVSKEPPEVLLILPRCEVVHKEFALENTAQADLPAVLLDKARRALPYGLEEMAYGLTLDVEKNPRRAGLFAASEIKIKEICSLLTVWNAAPSEIVTEDQAILWLLRQKEILETCLLLDWEEERLLALCVDSRHLVFSRAFEYGKYGSEDESFCAYHEISLELTARGITLARIWVTGKRPKDAVLDLKKFFSVPADSLKTRVDEKVPAVFEGASYWGRFETASLLPKKEKILRRRGFLRSCLREISLSVLLFAAAAAFGFSLELQKTNSRIQEAERTIQAARPVYLEARRKTEAARELLRNQDDKARILDVLRHSAAVFPSDVIVREMRFEKDALIIEGESRAHASLMEAVSALEKGGLIRTPKLGASRLRKRNNNDYLEFEVSGKWTD